MEGALEKEGPRESSNVFQHCRGHPHSRDSVCRGGRLHWNLILLSPSAKPDEQIDSRAVSDGAAFSGALLLRHQTFSSCSPQCVAEGRAHAFFPVLVILRNSKYFAFTKDLFSSPQMELMGSYLKWLCRALFWLTMLITSNFLGSVVSKQL